MGKGLKRQRGEGSTEYVILLLFVLICAVVGLFTSYSGSIKKMQLEKGLCLDCKDRATGTTPSTTPAPTTDPAGNGSTTPPSSGSNDPLGGNGGSTTGSAALPAGTPTDITSWWDSFRDFISWWYY